MTSVNTSATYSWLNSTGITGLTDIDTAQLVEAAYEAKLAPADQLQVKADANDVKSTAYGDLSDVVETLADTVEALTSSSALASLRDDVWAQSSAYLSTSDSSVTASSVLSATAENGTASGSWTLQVEQLATAQKIASDSVADSTAALGLDGSFSLALGDGTAATVTVTSDMSLDDLVDAVNAAGAGVTASVLQVSSDSAMLVLTADDTGQEISLADVSGDALSQLGVLDDSGAVANELRAAQQAVFTVDGVEITRSSNTVDDVLDGITLYLTAAEPDVDVELKVAPDYSGIEQAIEDFVDAYNSYRDFYDTQQAYTAGVGADDDAVLFGDSLLNRLNSTIAGTLTGSFGDETLDSLADIGITLDENNQLTIDSDTLESAIYDDLDSVEAIFSERSTTGSDDLLVSDGGGFSGSFTLDVTVGADGTITGASVDGDSSLFEIDGKKLVGAAGTAYEGVTLIYGGSASDSIAVEISQGLASVLNDQLDGYTGSSGSIQKAIQSLDSQTADYNDKIDDLTASAQDYAQKLYDRYAKLEAQLELLQQTRDQLAALWGTNDS
ncbi:flagellar hook-associated protein 2 [Tistlia consotensis]|uniref:Flagellar hook-associated protein 2 n=1 Tax=Tistlia consotensis USBA 355 TaxID=560819 RepID=A0A1Y6B8P7_9PROT|nr:flagellar filament capping protein FliD [Tistlia consotensis]SME96840.1 flagellar hook-associated protein 2 [Tistlia consotensis USBA 355]SNR56214.1 flagellar hook-associated protein 2 [Tistlia consotensis]